MNLFSIGLPEILFVLFLVILIFGPKDLEKTGKIIGTGLRKIIKSDIWRNIQQTGRELRNLPNRLMRESGLDELNQISKPELGKNSKAISMDGKNKDGS